ncbi:MAG TPA: cytochrome d ubiquinol oxidase subunit II [Mycobacteriales bacterium]|nr:cytochrome d ubiquinol oxidase subunit II [Mycobacteriales bacterium]
MTSADVVALILLLAVAAYACGGGADYGAGFWDLTAGNSDNGARPRALVDYAMAPVWEANNVWLIFVFILTWTGFPPVFEAVLSTAWIAITLAALGLVLRGAGFALRKPTRQAVRRRRYAAVFGVSSILTPFFFAAALGGVASGRIPVGNRAGDPVTSWLNPTSVLFGVLAVTASAFIAAVFLVSDARRFGAPDLETYFRRRSVLAGASLLAVAAVGLVVLRFDARHVFDGLLSGSGLVFVVLTVLATVGAVWLVRRGNHVGTRLAAIAAVASMVLAWGMAQRPYLLPTTVTVDAGARDPDSLRWLLIVTIVAVLVVAPALVLLYRLDLTDRLAADHDVDLTEAHSAPETTLTSPRRQDAPDAEPSPHP